MGEIFRHDRLKNLECDRVPLAENEKSALLRNDDLLFARQSLVLAGAGKCSIFLGDIEKVAFESHIIRVRLDQNKADPQFYYYLFRSPQGRSLIEAIVEQGAGASGVRSSDLQSLMVPYTFLSQQKAIARILSSLDDKIELNRRMNETLEAMARAIFKDWFVDFGPTRAKMSGRAAYLPEHIWSLFPEAIDPETGLPQGWKLATLGSIAESVNRTVNPTEIDEQTPYIGLEHMPRRSIALSDWEGAGKVTSNKLRFETGEFLFGKLRPYFHKVGIASLSGICSTDIVVVRAKSEIWSSFVITIISTDNFVEYTSLTSTGTKMPRTSWSIMAKYDLTLPPESLVKHFHLMIQPCTDQIIDNIHQNRTLADLRDRLLPKLMSGELRVKGAEKMAEDAV
ncbi:MAG: restriction endonuclease subunit S [Limnothrix sp. CACIAM 69d]|nr:MAG: restriction endonuclease subunit S [Limnothrix sp. CACIAM 69d]